MCGDSELKAEKLCEDDAKNIEWLLKEVWPKAKQYPHKWRKMRVIDPEQIRNEMENGFQYFGIRIDRKIVGFYKALKVGETCVGEHQTVHPVYRRRGLAKAMYKHFIQLARETGCRRIQVNILPNQVASKKLVKQFGFKKIREYEQIPEMLVHLYEKEIEC